MHLSEDKLGVELNQITYILIRQGICKHFKILYTSDSKAKEETSPLVALKLRPT